MHAQAQKLGKNSSGITGGFNNLQRFIAGQERFECHHAVRCLVFVYTVMLSSFMLCICFAVRDPGQAAYVHGPVLGALGFVGRDHYTENTDTWYYDADPKEGEVFQVTTIYLLPQQP